MKLYFHAILSRFRFYRRWKGGRWFLIANEESASGFSGPIMFWSENAPNDPEEIIKEETY
jgi:hypothetical protein